MARIRRQDERLLLFTYLEDRFGIHANVFADFDLFSRRKRWWLLRKTAGVSLPARLKVTQVGLKAFDRVVNHLKPATRLMQLFGHHATKGVWQISEAEFERLLRGEPLKVESTSEDGFVILRLREHVLGVGLLLKGMVNSRIRQSEAKRMVRYLRGIAQPTDCRLFGKGCTPRSPIGPCMVSHEGACKIWHTYRVQPS